MQDMDAPASANPYRLIIALMLAAACFVIGGMFYVMQLSKHIADTHFSAEAASEHIMANMNETHLWLEEVLAGDDEEDKQVIFDRFKQIEQDFNLLKNTGAHKHLFLQHNELNALPQLIKQAETIFHQLQKTAQYRLDHAHVSAVGSPSDQSYDKLFKSFQTHASKIRATLKQTLTTHNQHLNHVQTWIISLSLLIFILTSWLTLKLFANQRKSFEHVIKAELEKHAMEDKYRALIEQSPFAIQIMSPDGTLLQANQAWEKLWETTKEQLGNYNILEDTLLQTSPVFDDIKKGFLGEQVITDAVNLNPNQTSTSTPWKNRFVRIHIYPVKSNHHTIEQIVMIYADVTETYQQQAFQLGQNRILKQIADHQVSLEDVLTQLVLFVEKLSPQMMGSVLLLDEKSSRLFDISSPHLPSTYRKAIHGMEIGPDVGSCGTAAYTGKRIIVSDIATDPLWMNFKELASEHNLSACWSQPILDSKGKVLGTFAMYYQKPHQPQEVDLRLLQDAAQLAANAIVHKQTIEKIIESQSQLEEAQRLAQIGTWTLDLTNDKLTWSDEIYRIFEIDKHTFAASYEAFLNAIHPDDRDRVNQTYTKSLETKLPYEVTHRLLMADGRIKHVIERCETLFDAEGKPLKSTGTVQDITQLVEAQEAKELNMTKMEHVQRLESLGVLAGGIAHDFNNILTAIMGNASLASHHFSETSAANAYIENITRASQKAANLCKQMLAYSGKGKFVVKPINLTELVEELQQMLRVTIAKNVVLRLDLSKQLPSINADVTQMQQVIMNLVINAAEAIEQCSGSISIATGVTSIDKAYLTETFIDEDLEEGQYIYLEVSDTGCGMDEETHARIFEPFFTTKFTGRGLGMAAILGIVRGHKGAIKSYSELNKGTTFKVFLPRSKEEAVPISLDDKIKESWHSQGVVLVIDDEETIREVAVSMLKDMGLEALTAADGVEGVEIFKHHHQDIDAVLLDMTMPRMGGEDTFSELCRIDPEVKVILSSGYNEQDATNRFAGKGLAGFLQKPYTPEQLATQLAKIFDKT